MKACSAFPRVGEQWMNEGRVALQKHWGENVRRGRKALSIRTFARICRLSHSRLQRELKAGFTGVLLRDKVHGGWIYPEYSALLAQKRAEQANAAKGRRSVVTNLFVVRLVAFLARGLFRRHLPAHAPPQRLGAPPLATHRPLPPQRRRHRPAHWGAGRDPAPPPTTPPPFGALFI